MDRNLFILFLSGLILSCSDNKQTFTFSTADPRRDALKANKIKTLYYVIDSIAQDTTIYGNSNKVGDTLLMNKFDSAGNLTDSRTYKAFVVSTRFRYDENGFVKYKKVSSDFFLEWYVCTFIDTIKRIGYQKWFDQLSEEPPTIFYYNKNGLTDSMISARYNQSSTLRFKEYFLYNDGFLTMTIKKTFAKDTLNPGKTTLIPLDTTEYFYDQSRLTKIKQTIVFPPGIFNTTFEFFDMNERPYKEEVVFQHDRFIRLRIINAP